MRRIIVEITTAADGSATVYSPRISGEVHQLRYEKIDFADGVDFTVTTDALGETVWAQSNVNASATVAPRQPSHTTAGVAATLDGTVAALVPIALANDRLKVVVAQGGNAKTGKLHFLID